MNETVPVTKVTAEQNSSTQGAPLGPGGTDRFWALVASSGQPSDSLSDAALPGQPPSCRSRTEAAVLEVEPVQSGRGDAAAQEPLAAPSPNTMVVASRQHAIIMEGQASAREAAFRAEHAAEVARLNQTLRDLRMAHAAEIERLRRDHASELRRAVEAPWGRRDAPQAAVEYRADPEETAAPEPQARSPDRPRAAREWLARIRRRG
jgi:hypothetical protein